MEFKNHHHQNNPKVVISCLRWCHEIILLKKHSKRLEKYRVPTLEFTKVGCIFLMVVVSILPHTEFGPNDHREDVPHFTYLSGGTTSFEQKWVNSASFE